MSEEKIVIEKDARAELVRLQKEIHLLEHGFYDADIQEFYQELLDNDKEKLHEMLRKYNNLNPYNTKDLKIIWFKEKFPEFFNQN